MTGLLVAVACAAAVVVAASAVALLDRHEAVGIVAFLAAALTGAAAAWSWARWVLVRVGSAGEGAATDPLGQLPRALLASLPLSAVGLAVLLLLAARDVIGGPLDGVLAGAALGAGGGAGMTAALAGGAVASSWEAPAWPLAVAAAWGVVLGFAVGALRLESRTLRRAALGLGGVLAASALVSAVAATPVLPAVALALRAPLVRWLPLAWLAGAVGLVAAALAVERRVIAVELDDEARHGVVLDGVPALAASWFRRVRRTWWPRGDERREINRMLTALAFRKRRWRQLPEDRADVYGLEIGRLRERVRAVLNPRQAAAGDDAGG